MIPRIDPVRARVKRKRPTLSDKEENLRCCVILMMNQYTRKVIAVIAIPTRVICRADCFGFTTMMLTGYARNEMGEKSTNPLVESRNREGKSNFGYLGTWWLLTRQNEVCPG